MTQQMSSSNESGSSKAARGYIKLSGPDSSKFLQGQVTCDMDSLSPSNSIEGAHCTPKGRMVFLFTAHSDEGGSIILETHPSIIDSALASLKKYGVFSKLRSLMSAPVIQTTSLTYLIYGDCAPAVPKWLLKLSKCLFPRCSISMLLAISTLRKAVIPARKLWPAPTIEAQLSGACIT